MLRTILLVVFLVGASFLGLAQVPGPSLGTDALEVLTERQLSPYSVTIRGGLTQFFGELREQDMQSMVGVSITRQMQRGFSMSLDYTAGKVGGQKRDFFNSYFINEYNGLDLLARWNLTEQFSPNRESRLHTSVYGGLGLMMFSADAYDLTTGELVRFTNSAVSGRNPLFLRWGNPKGRLGIRKTNERTIPLGFNLDYQLARAWQIGMDYRYYFVRTDKLDATSGMSLENPEESTSYSDTPNDKFSFLSLTLTHRFSQNTRDTDKDGIPDDRDRCPDVPGPVQFFGCPDTDGDGIPDYVDRCPTVAGSVEARGCPDSDGDGIIDQNDPCPNEAGTANGCPDRDGDGVADSVDSCPDIPGDPRYGGCPDTDGDGIGDHVDLCPDRAGTYANGGCPDTDGDGIHDGIDRCPDEPGPRSREGCPIVSAAVRQSLQSRIDSVLTVPIRFTSGTDVIERGSYATLNALAMVLLSNPSARFIIEGHSDDSGSAEANQKLSERRASALEQYLIYQGVGGAQLNVTGLGDTQPIGDNSTVAGRTLNRRVVVRVRE
jgi:outer membrane protein OmpA-like peptidoglycan-associated protein